MPVSARSILYSWFGISQRKPQTGEFKSWIDSFWHKTEDLIPIERIDGLSLVLAGKAGNADINPDAGNQPIVLTGVPSFAVPTRMLIDKIIVEEDMAINLIIGTTDGGADLKNEPVTGVAVFSNFDYYKREDTTLYFGGITANTIITIYPR